MEDLLGIRELGLVDPWVIRSFHINDCILEGKSRMNAWNVR